MVEFLLFSSLEEIHFGNNEFEKLTTIGNHFFASNHELKKIDLSSFKNVKLFDLFGFFYECSNLEVVNVAGFGVDTKTQKSVEDEFVLDECPRLKKFIISKHISKEFRQKLFLAELQQCVFEEI